MKKFSVYENKDAANAFKDALIEAGYEYVKKMWDSDFMLLDHERNGNRRYNIEEYAKERPVFIYPHTPFTCWLWDGITEPLQEIACNFVAGNGSKKIMRTYGYENRVEVVGFPRCEVLDFQPSWGRDLLFVPARPRRDNGRQAEKDAFAWQWVREHRGHFDNVTVCYLDGQFDEAKYKSFNFIKTNPRRTLQPSKQMYTRIDNYDIVISTTTPAALGVARGKYTVFYGEGFPPETINGKRVKSYQKYKHLYDFPLTLEDFTDIGDFMQGRNKYNPAVGLWKTNMIGENFNADKFISIVQEYV